MVQTIRATRSRGASQSFAAAASFAADLRATHRAIDCKHAPPTSQAEGRLGWPPRHPARTAQIEVGPTDPLAVHDPARVASAWVDQYARNSVLRLFSQTTDGGDGDA